ncbi:Trihydrophobin [Orbilia brochopaga]|nr:Trihydrophobin [Drechslerella brochopaga]
MQLYFSFAVIFATAFAAPQMAKRDSVCSGGLYTSLQCCAPDVLGVACLDSTTPSEQPRDAQHFRQICAATGKAAKCCVFPVADQDLLCKDEI